ncbi:MAG: hypothetical protein NTW95_07995 [Candidatus Aminicenantes bacterium]|nr:hypothetical protein [Candidatus Aminicenantes bacterium]
MVFPGRKKILWRAVAAAVLATIALAGFIVAGRKNRETAAVPAGPPAPAVLPGQGIILFQSRVDELWQIFSLDLATGSKNRLTRSAADDYYPSASPDGSWIVFESIRSGSAAVWRMRADGSAVELLTRGKGECRAPCWDNPSRRFARRFDDRLFPKQAGLGCLSHEPGRFECQGPHVQGGKLPPRLVPGWQADRFCIRCR